MTERINSHKIYLALIISLSTILALTLFYNTYYINYWPTDSQIPYIPVAAQLFELPYLSHMHSVLVQEMFFFTMHGKETLIFAIAVMQKLLGDTTSLFPNVLLLIINVYVSSILVYYIVKEFCDEHIGFITYLLFTTCFWPYLYILQGSHQPLSLMNFLVSLFFLQVAVRRRFFYFLSGVFAGFTLFSSPTSPLFAPYYFAMLLFVSIKSSPKFRTSHVLFNCLLILVGAVAVALLFTIPDPIKSINDYIKFLAMSQNKNTFMLYRDFISQYFFVSEHFRGAGWSWIFKYFFFIMPVIFPCYLLCIGYLLKKSIKQPSLFIIIGLSILPPVAVEISQVAQFGRNYFPWIVGIFGLIGYTFFLIKKDYKISSVHLFKNRFFLIGLGLVCIHIIFNFYVFLTDVFPSRMVTTNIYNWCLHNKVTDLYAYYEHPRNKNVLWFLNNPKHGVEISAKPIRTIRDVPKGYILIPPISGKTIYDECREGDYQGDPYLTELILSNKLDHYVAASFKSLGSSRIWTQEEELCTYRDLSLGQISAEDRKKGYALILDAKKLQDEWFANRK